MHLRISGAVEKFATIHPNRVRLFGKVGEAVSALVTITPEPKYPFRIVKAEPLKANNLRCRLETADPSQGPHRLKIENIRTSPGRYTEVIRLQTDSDIQPELRLYVYGNIIAEAVQPPAPQVPSEPPKTPDATDSPS